jgi:hypothetical protein
MQEPLPPVDVSPSVGQLPLRETWLIWLLGSKPAHIGYFVPLTKIADFLKAGVQVKILLAGKPGSSALIGTLSDVSDSIDANSHF